MKYYKTAKNNNTVGFWEECNATELSAAKREATRDCGSGYMDDVVSVGVPEFDCEDSPIKTIAEKRSGKWVEVA